MIHQAIFSGHWKTYKISVRVIKILSPNFVYKGKEVIAGNYSIAVPTSKVLTACSRSWWGRERWGRGEMGCLNNSRSVCWDLEPFPNTRSKHTNVLRPNFRIRTCGIGPHSMKVFSQSKNKINAGPPPPRPLPPNVGHYSNELAILIPCKRRKQQQQQHAFGCPASTAGKWSISPNSQLERKLMSSFVHKCRIVLSIQRKMAANTFCTSTWMSYSLKGWRSKA